MTAATIYDGITRIRITPLKTTTGTGWNVQGKLSGSLKRKIKAARLSRLHPQGQGNTLATAVSHQGISSSASWGIKAEEITATYGVAQSRHNLKAQHPGESEQIPLKVFADSQAAHAQRKERNQLKQLYAAKVSGGNDSLITLRTQNWAFMAARRRAKTLQTFSFDPRSITPLEWRQTLHWQTLIKIISPYIICQLVENEIISEGKHYHPEPVHHHFIHKDWPSLKHTKSASKEEQKN